MARTCGQSSKPGSTALTSTINTVSSANEKLRAQCDIAELITAYREGASAARLVAAHGVGLASVQRFQGVAGVRRMPHSSIYERNAGCNASVAASLGEIHIRQPSADTKRRSKYPGVWPESSGASAGLIRRLPCPQ
jgi:hypothetical protein